MSVETDLLKRALEALQDSGDRHRYLKEDIQRYLDNFVVTCDLSPCCNATLASYRSFGKKVCTDCLQEYQWPLKEGQQPLIKYTR